MTTELILIRHGETDWNVEGRYQGQAGPGLNSRGREQALAAAELAHVAVDAVYSSDLARAREAAEIVARVLCLPVTLDARLREIHQGDWQAMMYADIQARYIAELERFRRDPLHRSPPSGETLAELAIRVLSMLDAAARRHPAQRLAMVTHKLPIALIRCIMEHRPARHMWDAIPGNAPMVRLHWHEARSKGAFELWLSTAG